MSSYIGLNQEQASAVPTPNSGRQRYFVDQSDGLFKKKKDDGSIIQVEQTGSQLSVTSPTSVGASSVVGVSTFVSREDHVHAHGSQAGGTTHAVATTSVAGFLSAADKTKLDGLADFVTGLAETYGIPIDGDSVVAAISKLMFSQSLQQKDINIDFTVPSGWNLLRGPTRITGAAKLIVESGAKVKFI